MMKLIFLHTVRIGNVSVIRVEAGIKTCPNEECAEFAQVIQPCVVDRAFYDHCSWDGVNSKEGAEQFKGFLEEFCDRYDPADKLIPVGLGVKQNLNDIYFWFRQHGEKYSGAFFSSPGIDLYPFCANVWYHRGLMDIPDDSQVLVYKTLSMLGAISEDTVISAPLALELLYENLCNV